MNASSIRQVSILCIVFFLVFGMLKTHPVFGSDKISAENKKELEALDAMLKHYNSVLLPDTKSTGMFDALVMNEGRLKSLYRLLRRMRAPQAEIVDYWAGRMLDLTFAGKIVETLKQSLVFARDATELEQTGDVYREVYDADQTVRYHTGYTADEKTDLIRRLNVPGRLRELKRVIINILEDMGYLNRDVNPEWAPVYGFLRGDLAGMVHLASNKRTESLEFSHSSADAYYWEWTDEKPTLVDKAYEELKRLKLERESAHVTLVFADFKPDLPVEFLESNMSLNAYLDAIIAYDEEVIWLFNLREVKEDHSLQQDLNSLFRIRESVRRRKALLTGGRRLFAGSLLLEIAEMSVRGDRFARSDNLNYQAILYASIALRLNSSNESASQIIARCSERLRELDPQKLTAVEFIRHGFSYAVTGDYDNALEILEKGALAHPNDDHLLEWYVVVSYATDGLESAVSIWRQKHPERGLGKWGGNRIRPDVAYLAYLGLWDFAEDAESKNMLYALIKHYSLAHRAVAVFKDIDHKWMKKQQEILRDKIFAIYKKLPLKPEPPDQARRYSAEAQQYLEQREWKLAEGKYMQALEQAPWWPEAHYNLALVTVVNWGPSPLAVQEMELYLELEPNGTHVRNARKKSKRWKGLIQQAVNSGGAFIEGLPFLITPDVAK